MSLDATRGAMRKKRSSNARRTLEEMDSKIETKQRGLSELAEIFDRVWSHYENAICNPIPERRRGFSVPVWKNDDVLLSQVLGRGFPESATVCRALSHRYFSSGFRKPIMLTNSSPRFVTRKPTTPVRAAWFLGERREEKAVSALTKIVKKAKDAFLVESAVETLSKKLAVTAATAAVHDATQHSSLRVRVKARNVLIQHRSAEGSRKL